jgi:hypothetical protein
MVVQAELHVLCSIILNWEFYHKCRGFILVYINWKLKEAVQLAASLEVSGYLSDANYIS